MMMSKKAAIKTLRSMQNARKPEELDAVDIAEIAINKAYPLKPDRHKVPIVNADGEPVAYTSFFTCGKCYERMGMEYEWETMNGWRYCPKCGQKIDWMELHGEAD